ncbi:hypothetical protein GCM10009727_41530 [Actinomadura napierensis]|uniref:Uncharacterized protein n=1 Tax=Actinomadura napierensis TaxID=267854 RepID=A0ABN2ZJ18_9ACTN
MGLFCADEDAALDLGEVPHVHTVDAQSVTDRGAAPAVAGMVLELLDGPRSRRSAVVTGSAASAEEVLLDAR